MENHKLNKDEMFWAFWHKSYAYKVDELKICLLLSGDISQNLEEYVVCVKEFDVIDNNKLDASRPKEIRFYRLSLEEHKTIKSDVNDLLFEGVKLHLKTKN